LQCHGTSAFYTPSGNSPRALAAWEVSHIIPFQQIHLIIGEHKCEGQSKKARASAPQILFFGGCATAFSAFKFSAQNGLFFGEMTGPWCEA
jgi:hypothetical protein